MKGNNFTSNRGKQRISFWLGMAVALVITLVVIELEAAYFSTMKWWFITSVVLFVGGIQALIECGRYCRTMQRRVRRGEQLSDKEVFWSYLLSTLAVPLLMAAAAGVIMFFSTHPTGGVFWWAFTLIVFYGTVIWINHRYHAKQYADKLRSAMRVIRRKAV